MRDRICIVCGEKAERGNFCKEHFLEKNSLTEVPDTIQLNRCDNCLRFNINNDLKSIDEETAVREILEDSMDMENVNNMDILKITNNRIKIRLEGQLEGLSKVEEHTIIYEPTKRLCDFCSKKKGGYYEGIIQIRPKSIEALEKIIGDKAVVGLEELDEGFDVYILTKKDLSRLANELNDMTEERKVSHTQTGVSDSGKKVTRTTILLRVKEND